MDWVYVLDIMGVFVFALTGVVLACQSRMDPFGMLVLAAATGVGGGTLRDLFLGIRPVFWVTDPTYLWVVLITVLLSIVGFRYIHRLTRVFLPVTDAFGLAIFTVLGAHKAITLEAPGTVAVLMGLMTGVAGGMIRDVLAQRVPMVLRQEVYATASIAGGTAYVVSVAINLPPLLSIGLGVATVLGVRLPAIYWQLSLPTFAWIEASTNAEEGIGSASYPKRTARLRAKLTRSSHSNSSRPRD